MDKNKTKAIDNEKTKLSDYYISGSSATTIHSEGLPSSGSLSGDINLNNDKTMSVFDKEDIRKKLDDELVEIPEVEPEEFQSEYLSRLVSRPFAHRTEEERLKINRNFLKDAEPLTLERLKEDIENAPEELSTGFAGLDRWISIPNRNFTFIAARPQHGKTLFILNMLLNMCRTYQNKHFLYYSYGEPRQEIELKLINMSGDSPFSPHQFNGVSNNFKRWKYELKNQKLESLIQLAKNNPEYIGLKRFLDIAPRLHIIDGNYHIVDLLDSIKAFDSTLPIGAIFIDCLQSIRPEKTNLGLNRQQQIQEISDQLMDVCNKSAYPFILGVQLARGELNAPEYDGLHVKAIKDVKDPEQMAGLIIGIQNYAKSEFIGSNINDQFKSRFFQYTLKKPEKMPETFKDKHPNTVILAKVMVNRAGPAPEVELLHDKWLMKISDFDNTSKHLNQYDFLR